MENLETYKAYEEDYTVKFYKLGQQTKEGNFNFLRKVKFIPLEIEKEYIEFYVLAYEFLFPVGSNSYWQYQIAYIFEKLLIKSNHRGNIIDIDNTNLKEIQQKWETTQKHLRTDHAGSALLDYFSHLSQVVYSKEMMIDFLKTNSMYGIFFNGLWDFKNLRQDFKIKEIPEKKQTLIFREKKLQNKSGKEIQEYEEYIFHSEKKLLIEASQVNNDYKYDLLCLELKN